MTFYVTDDRHRIIRDDNLIVRSHMNERVPYVGLSRPVIIYARPENLSFLMRLYTTIAIRPMLAGRKNDAGDWSDAKIRLEVGDVCEIVQIGRTPLRWLIHRLEAIGRNAPDRDFGVPEIEIDENYIRIEDRDV